MNMPTPNMTEKEIIDYLGKTTLPTVLVEGEDDVAIYRWLENQLGVFNGSVLFCGGRDVLISIYRKRAVFSHKKVAWLADLDMWKFSDVPADLEGIIFTTGYSIENDLYAGSEIESLLDEAEKALHSQLLTVVSRWFVFEIIEYQAGRYANIASNINRVVDLYTMDISPKFAVDRGYLEPNQTLVNAVLADYKLQLRGKTLLQVLIKYLSGTGRNAKYSYSIIIEMCLKLYPNNAYVKRITEKVKAQL